MDLPLTSALKTILVVEDTPLVLNTVRMILERANFTVLTAASADEAMRLAGCGKTIDLLLSDVTMPDISGPDLALKLKELRPEMRVILIAEICNTGCELALLYSRSPCLMCFTV